MTKTFNKSPFVRQENPKPMKLMPRDVRILKSIYDYRYLSIEHINNLYFYGKSVRCVQERMRKLWNNEYVDRHYIPIRLVDLNVPYSTKPLYMLGRKGAEVVSYATNTPIKDIPHTPKQNQVGFYTLEHNLAAIDLLLAIQTACLWNEQAMKAEIVEIESEYALKSKLKSYIRDYSPPKNLILSDGCVTLEFPETGKRITFYIEIIRSNMRGGNKLILEKMYRYLGLEKRGFFKRAYGHDKICVLFATTSQNRAANFRELAKKEVHCHKDMFLFGAFEKSTKLTEPASMFSEKSVLEPVWTAVNGKEHSLFNCPRVLKTDHGKKCG